jgi:hypothetical protein
VATSHKFAGERLIATTKLDHTVIAKLAQEVSKAAHGNAWNNPGKVKFQQAAGDRLTFSVQAAGPLKRELMTFALTTRSDGEKTKIEVRIETYKTMRPEFLGFIPLGPVKLLGISAYRDFIQRLGAALPHLDTSASVSVG